MDANTSKTSAAVEYVNFAIQVAIDLPKQMPKSICRYDCSIYHFCPHLTNQALKTKYTTPAELKNSLKQRIE